MSKHAIIKAFLSSDPWINFRLMLIAERGNKCQRCGKIIPRSIDIIGHHKIELTPENVHDYNISLNPENVDLVCFGCHNAIHKRFGQQKKGRTVYVIYGPPLSGKRQYVQEHVQRGDIVIDMDRLYQAMSGLPYYDKPDNLLTNVMGVHSLLIDNIKTRHGKWNDAYIVGGYADKYKRDKLVADLGAELIFMDVSIEECLSRLNTDTDRSYRQDEWAGYIRKWFEQYVE